MQETLKYSALVAAVALLTAACDKVPLLAPASSTISLSANSLVVPINGTTGLTAFVTESSGTPVQNGTTVRFTTTLGTLTPAETQTTNGIAVTTFQAGTSSGIAEVHAVSGGATGTTSGTTTATNVVKLTVGSAAANKVTVRANPSSVAASGGTVEIVASVTGGAASTDTSPVPGISVSFSTTAGTLSATSATTDASGTARVQLTTSRKATVTASVGANAGTVDVTVSPTASVALATSPASPTVNQAVALTVTPATDTAPAVIVDWGDGAVTDMGIVSAARSITHAYNSPGSYTVTATASDGGSVFSTSTIVTVAPRLVFGVNVSASSGTPKKDTPVEFTATVTGDTNAPVTSYQWTFTDNTENSSTTVTTSGNKITRSFNNTGTKTIEVVARTSDGRSASSQTQIVVQP